MSKSAKQIYTILIFLILGCAGFAGYAFFEKQQAEQENTRLQEELSQAQDREKKSIVETRTLKDQISTYKSQQEHLKRQAMQAQEEATQLLAKASELELEKEKWQQQAAQLSDERDSLMKRLEGMLKGQEKLREELEIIKTSSLEPVEEDKQSNPVMEQDVSSSRGVMNGLEDVDDSVVSKEESFWAQILKQKANLEVKLQQTQEELVKRTQEIVELKQQNANSKLELEALQSNTQMLSEEIRYKGDLINNLSLELARTKNEKKFVSDRVARLNEENNSLRVDMKKLVSSKGSLEKSIVRLSQEKDKTSKKLQETESMIQNQINEIWEIKDSIDRNFDAARNVVSSASVQEVELSPIVVSASGGAVVPFDPGMSSPGVDGRVVSVNHENNFIIIDVGQAQGIQIGDVLSVYRNNKYIASVGIIQVRKDICAADVKDQWQSIEVGDVVR